MDYDCIVIGGGHAGIEASLAVARMGFSCMLLTQNPDKIGALSCNPAVGGLAKGNIVREIDALGGEMARLIDRSLIQYRVLNRSRGPAVQAPRAQADKLVYQREARLSVEAQSRLSVFMDTAVDLLVSRDGRAVEGVVTERGHKISAKTVILAGGTFLEGRVFIGEYDAVAGRLGEGAALGLGKRLRDMGFPVGRLKTGTPARIAGNTIDYDAIERQDGETPAFFSFNVDKDAKLDRPSATCWISYTNLRTHDIIRANIHRSPLYGGKITGVGPRYCPSIEDKVVRFPDRDRHHIFIEPESLFTNEMYLNGLSSSLPEDVQEAFIHSIQGLSHARIVRPAYAVEYDYLDPLCLYPTLESKWLEGFFSAGQTNGSSGYEEAAAQGLMAGINAALKMRGEPPFVLRRAEAYIGVLIDDLTTFGTKEPYRLFTSRAEHRLVLRCDTADERLTSKGRDVGLADDERWARFLEKNAALETVRELLRTRTTEVGAKSGGAESSVRPLSRAIVDGGLAVDELPALMPDFPAEWVTRAGLDVKYAGYIEKENRAAERNAKMDAVRLDPAFDYRAVSGLSAEAKEKLSLVRPLTLGQAARVPGVRQGDTALLAALMRRG